MSSPSLRQNPVYSTNRYSALAAALLAAMTAASSAHAGDVIKANNTTALNLAGSWTTVAPTATDVAVWNNTVTGANAPVLGGNVSWQGIRIANNAGGAVTINGSAVATLTLGSAGIDMSVANQNLSFGTTPVPVILSANQTWNIGSSRTLTFSANGGSGTNIDLNGTTLSTSGAGNIVINNKNSLTSATAATLNVNNNQLSFESGGSTTVSIAANITTNVASGRALQLRGNSGAGNVAINSNGLVNVDGGTFRITNSSNVQINQTGKLVLRNGATLTNNYGGNTTSHTRLRLSGGVEIIGTNNAWNETASFEGTILVASPNPTIFDSALTGNGTLNYQNTSTTRQANWSGDNSGFTGTVNINGGSGNRNLRLTSATAGSALATWAPAAGNILQVDGVAVNLGTLNGAGTVTNSHATNVAAITVGNGSFSGSITNGTPALGMSLTKDTGGTLTLSGSGTTFTGATNITGGKLVANQTGALSTGSAISVNGSGAIFDGTGTFGAVTVADNLGTVQNGNGTSGALTLSSLTFNGDATLNVVTSSATPSARVVVTGALTTTPGSGTVTVNGSGSWTNGVNNLVSFGSFGGALTDFTLGSLTGLTSRQASGGLSLSGSNLFLTVNGDSPKWTGSDNGNWVVGTTGPNGNWQLITGGGQTDFIASDIVLFDDSAPGTKTVNVSAANVSVASAEFNTSTAYTLTGGFGISAGTIAKNGSGSLTIENANTTSGGVQLNAGTLNVNNNGALGTGALAIAAGTTLDNTSGSAQVTTNAQNWNGNFTFTGTNDLSLGSATLNADRQVTVSANTLTVGGIAGGFGITKEGAGTLAVGASSYTGATNVNGGTLKSNSATAFSNTSSVNLANTAGVALDVNGINQTINTITGGGATGGDINLNGAVLTTGTAANNTFAGDLVGAGGLTKQGTGTFTLSGDKSGYTGTTTINTGVLDVGTVSGGFGSTLNINNGTVLQANGSLTGSLGTGNQIVAGNGGFAARGGNLTVNLFGDARTIQMTGSGNTLGNGLVLGSSTADSRVIFQNSLGINNFSATRTITVNSGTGTDSAEIAGIVSNGTAGGDSGINKTGNGDLILSAANTITGSTTIGAGRIVLGNNQALQFTSLNTDNAGRVGATGFTTPTIGGLSGSTALGTFINSGYSSVTSLTLAPQTGRSLTYTGTIADGSAGMNLVKSGAGTQTFNAAQTYTGITTISGGTLALGANGSLATSSAIINNATFDVSAVTGGFTVGAAQTLGGSGTVNGAVTVNGNLAPGTSPGVLTFNSPLTLAGTTAFEINGLTRGTEYDGVNTVAGLLTYGGTMSFNFGAATSDGATYDLFQIGAGGLAGSFSSISISGSYTVASSAPVGGIWSGSAGGFDFVFTESTGDLVVSTVAIPEPFSFAALAGLGALGFIATRRRQQAK